MGRGAVMGVSMMVTFGGIIYLGHLPLGKGF